MRRRLGASIFLVLLVVGMGKRPLYAADSVVGTGTPASCTEAAFNTAVAAVQGSSGGTITFNCGGAKTILLQQQLVTPPSDTTIDGGGQITLSGNNNSRIFFVGGSLTIRNITLTNGYVDDYGGAVFVPFTTSFTAVNSTIQNSQSGRWAGSAIFGEGDAQITLIDSVVQNNRTTNYGAINSTGPVTIINSVLQNNQSDTGGGALSVNNDVIIQNSLLSHNSTEGGNGGAILVGGNAYVTIENSTISNNYADFEGGGIYNLGETIVYRSTIIGNFSDYSGGGISNGNYVGFDPIMRVNQSLITKNSAKVLGGGADIRGGIGTFDNTTFSRNYSNSVGGLDTKNSEVSLTYVTIYGSNGGANFRAGNGSKVTITNTIIADPLYGDNCIASGSATVTSNGFNLVTDKSCQVYLWKGGDLNNIPAHLDSDLADNGGPTLTHMLKANSPAIDAGKCLGGGLQVDQRNAPRPAGNACDMGAVEYGAMAWQVFLPSVIR